MDAYARLGQELSAHLLRGAPRRITAKAALAAVAGLPLANPVQAARECGQLLDAMLATAWRGGDRSTVLARLRAAVDGLCRGVAQSLLAERHPLPPAAAESAGMAQQLTWRLACNDALALHELCAPAGRVPRFRGRAPAVAACAAGLYHGGQALAWAYRQYRAPPSGTWRFIHALYAAADELGIAREPAAEACFDGGPVSARDVYAQVLLLALSNPYRFSAPELEEAQALTAFLASECVLAGADARGFAIDPGADAGPGYVAGERVAAGAGALVLDVTPATRLMKQHVRFSAAPSDPVELARPDGRTITTSTGFLRRIASGWGSIERGHDRLPASHRLDAAFGMHAAHYVLAGNSDFQAFVARVESDATGMPAPEALVASPGGREPARPQPFRAEVLDQGEGGYRLRLQGADGQSVRIGEIVALAPAAEDPDDREWMVGVVRWLRLENAHACVGIELLHRVARAAALRPLQSDAAAAAPLRAIDVSGGAESEGLVLLVSHAPPGVATAEITLPARAADWISRARVATCGVASVATLGSACFQVKLEPAGSIDGR